MFAIDFAPGAAEEMIFGERARYGFVKLDTYEERFVAPLVYWTVAAYRRQWREGIRRCLDGQARSCLITSMRDPQTANFIQWWPLYRVVDDVYLQNQILLLDQIHGAFVPSEPYAHVPERRTVNADGERISEWHIRVEDLQEFFNQTVRPWPRGDEIP